MFQVGIAKDRHFQQDSRLLLDRQGSKFDHLVTNSYHLCKESTMNL